MSTGGCDTTGECVRAAWERAAEQRVRRALWGAVSSLCQSWSVHKRHTAEGQIGGDIP